MYTIFYTADARLDLRALDIKIANRIINKLFYYSQQKNPFSYAKKLTDSKIGTYRFRIGHYRALFDIDSKGILQILMILRIKHRKDIYFS